MNLASGDIDGDGKEEIITGAGPGGGPHVRIFDSQANLVGQFFAYNSGFRGGVKVACANINGNISRNKDEIIISPQSQGSPQIRVFNNYAQPLIQFFAYSKSFRGGVNLASGDIDKDGLAEIITGAGSGGGPHVRIFNQTGEIIKSFYAYERGFSGGVNPEMIKIR